MFTESEVFAKLNRIADRKAKELEILYSGGGPQDVLDDVGAYLSEVAKLIASNRDLGLAYGVHMIVNHIDATLLEISKEIQKGQRDAT